MALKSFFGLLTLQVGATILATVFFTLASIMLISNVFYAKMESSTQENNNENGSYNEFALLFVLITSVGFIAIGILSFLSSYHENRSIALAALFAIIIVLLYWLILSALSFITSPTFMKEICVHRHCPETFWLVPLNYKTQDNQYVEESDKNQNTTNPNNNGTHLSFNKNIFKSDIFFYNQTYSNNESLSNVPHKNISNNWEYIFSGQIIAALILFIVNLIFMVYSAQVLWGWAEELKLFDVNYY